MLTKILDYDSIPEPVYTGKVLLGWAYDSSGTNMVGADDLITADDTIYAIWEDE